MGLPGARCCRGSQLTPCPFGGMASKSLGRSERCENGFIRASLVDLGFPRDEELVAAADDFSRDLDQRERDE